MAFLLVLEPGNIFRAAEAGFALDAAHEAARIVIASLLGATATPVVLYLLGNHPVVGPRRTRNVLIHLAASVILALGLIIASCLLVAWLDQGALLPTLKAVREQIVNNAMLLVYALLTFSALAHMMRPALPRPSAPAVVAAPLLLAGEPGFLTQVLVKARNSQYSVGIDQVDWIESQGNYLALHTGSTTHLIRETLAELEAQLDPAQFVRVHRSAIVAIHQIEKIQPSTNGDAYLILRSGARVKASRSHRDSIRQRWSQVHLTTE